MNTNGHQWGGRRPAVGRVEKEAAEGSEGVLGSGRGHGRKRTQGTQRGHPRRSMKIATRIMHTDRLQCR